MRLIVFAIVLAFPVLDLYATVRFARWSGVPVWVWIALSTLAGLVLLRNERLAFRARTVAALHGEQSVLRGLLDSGRKVLAGMLLLLPGVVRGPDGRLRIKGGQPSQGALQVSSVSLNDPSSGDFDLDLPGQSLESVEVLANPFAAEYGRFSTSVTQVRTRRGTNDWEIKPGNLMPRFRKSFSGVRGFEPRFSMRGPIKRDRAFIAQDFQFRYVATPVKSLVDEPEVELTSFDSFTRVDTVVSARHTLGGGMILFPREIKRAMMSTFRPPEVTPDFNQSGWSTGIVDRLALAPDAVLETTVSGRRFEIATRWV